MGNTKYTDDAITTLSSSLSAIATNMIVASNTNFAGLASAPTYFYATLVKATNGAKETVKVTDNATTTWAIDRAQGDGELALEFDAADEVSIRVGENLLDAFTHKDDLAATTGAALVGKTGSGTVQDHIDITDPMTKATALAHTKMYLGAEVTLTDRGNSVWVAVLASGVTPNTFNILLCTGVDTLALVLRTTNEINVLEMGADNTAVTTASALFQAANDALPAVGGTIFAPAGSYNLDQASGVSLSSNVTLKGEGDNTIFVLGGGLAIKADTKTNVAIEDCFIQSESNYIYFKLCTGVTTRNVSGQGLITATGELSEYHVRCEGSTDINIYNPVIDNYNYGYFFEEEAGGSVRCGDCRVYGGLIQQTDATHGLNISNPSGINARRAVSLTVIGTTFKNIKPSLADATPFWGFGVYEGDGADGDVDYVIVKDCTFIDDDGFTLTRPMQGTLSTIANWCTVDGCDFTGPMTAVFGGARVQTIKNCFMNGSAINLSSTTGITPISLDIHNNTIINVATELPILAWAAASTKIPYASIVGNTIKNCAKGVHVGVIGYAHITDNMLIDVNTSGSSLGSEKAGFNFSGCNDGFVDGNTVINEVDGRASYGVSSSANESNHTIVVTPNNRFVGMLTGTFENGFTGLPTYGNWDAGTDIKYWDATTSPGCSVTTTGSMGTLAGVTGAITTGTPDLVVNDSTNILVGHWLAIAGVTGRLLVVAKSGTAITLASNADATVGPVAAVTFSAATFKTQATMV